MRKILWNTIKLSPVVVAAAFATANSAFAGEMGQNVPSVSEMAQAQKTDNIGQVTSVSQFSDVQPTDWAFQALQSLVERYGCIAGYPNGTYRGNRALTRYEFAAGLNACLDRVNELIATATADLVRKEDLATLQRLQEEFSAELATLRGRVDNLEARTAELEANQFSTTTKLVGEAIFSVSDAFGEEQAVSSRTLVTGAPATRRDLDENSNTVLSQRVRLNLLSSFSGKDQLQIRLQSGNTVNNSSVTGTNMTRLAYDNNTNNGVEIDKINYAFNLSDAIRIKVDANNGEVWENINNFNPDFASSSRGSISRYGRFSPIYRQGAGGAGATITFNPSGAISVSAAYLAGGRENRASSPLDRDGLFESNYAAIGQIAFQPSRQLGIGLTYAHSYQNPFTAATATAARTAGGGVNVFESLGSTLASQPFGNIATSSNHYGAQVNFRLSDKIAIGGWYGLADISGETGVDNNRLDATATYWAANLALRDFGSKGSLLGVTFGQPPRITGSNFRGIDATGRAGNAAGIRQIDEDTSYHLETLYRLQLNDNVSVTPALLVIFNPEHNNDNDTIYIGTLRTTFTF
ncbi:porin [Dulcicalothrix desertica PCC 7102]|uniref:Porin n=1 Tax=Dulcicalothrix desertica PCC 7102 TaxID=232991 RepID=A0A3S1CUQ7_9CYAN|nr:iron uptake porin [Dulcicalothrix desertica]RUT09778.1 porin [Dulcicalothrix desertica PCC 7102]TWH50967.1 Carbohydrate-selective porin [Dulcicalothrix desertica PCC 7102]